MIKFFRRIRQKLLSENKFSKYLLYAIGEIVLVVIGILIALQVNDWNEERKSLDKEQQYLTEIKNSLVSDSIQIQSILEFNKEKVLVVQRFIGLFADTLTNKERFEIIKKYSIPFTNYEVFLPNNTAWNNLVSAENVNLVKDRNLRNILMEYYGFDYNSSIQERIKTMNRKVIDENFPSFFTKEYVQANLGISTDMPSIEESTIHLNQVFLSDLFGITFLLSLQDQFLVDINTDINEALKIINQRLENP
nr:DUF6090 family protein [Allomuricauda sp.]